MAELTYDFLAPPRICFGWGRRAEVGLLARTLGKRAFVISGSRTLDRLGELARLRQSLENAGVPAIDAGSIHREPRVVDVDNTARLLREHSAGAGDLIVALGGGSAIDLGKAAGALVTNPQSQTIKDYLEGVGAGLKIEHPPLPLLAMPTTSGAGSEATKNAVISSDDPPFKKSVRSDLMVPRIALVDPELSVHTPATITAWTGMDAITQLIESYLSRKARPIPQALALAGLELAIGAIETAVRDGANRPAREKMAHAALLSGMALANSGLGMAHGVAAAMGIHCQTPHGLACAVILPVALRINRLVCEESMARLAPVITGKYWSSASTAADAVTRTIEELCQAVDIPRRLRDVGVQREQIPELAVASRGSSMSGNPKELTDVELTDILEEQW